MHDRQSLQELYSGFVLAIETTLDKRAPKRESSRTVRSNGTWYNHDERDSSCCEDMQSKDH